MVNHEPSSWGVFTCSSYQDPSSQAEYNDETYQAAHIALEEIKHVSVLHVEEARNSRTYKQSLR